MDTTPSDTRPGDWRRDWRSFGPPQIAAFAMLAVAVLILGFWFMRWSTTPTWTVAAAGLSPSEAIDAREVLDGAGIENRLIDGGTGLEVAEADRAEAAVVLGDAGVVGQVSEGYEILDRQGFTTSSFKQRIDYQRAVEGELARTITSLETVTSASVHLAIPESSVFSESSAATRASVVVSGDVDQRSVESIVNIVASSVPDLDPSNVTVADSSGRILSSLDSGAMVSDQQLAMRDLYESQLELNVETMLATALGPGRAIVRVTADLDFDEIESESLDYTPADQVRLRQQIVGEAYSGDGTVPAGVVGVIDDVADAGTGITGGDGTGYVRQEDTSEFGVPSTRTVTRRAPGDVRRLTVAVLVDETLDPLPDRAVLETLLANAVGLDVGRGDALDVQFLPFEPNALEATDAAATDAAAGGGGMSSILNIVKTAVAVIGLILALLFLRKGMRPLMLVRRADEPASLEAGAAAALGAGEAGADQADRPGSVDADGNPLPAGGVDASSPTTALPAVSAEGSPVPGQPAGAATGTAGAGTGAAGVPGTGPAGHDGNEPRGDASLVESDPSAASTIDMLQLIDQQHDEVAELLRGWMAEVG